MSQRDSDLAPLPNVISVAFGYAVYDDHPRQVPVNGTIVTYTDAVEIFIETDAAIQARDQAPVLYVGTVPITEGRALSETLYAFVVYDYQNLPVGGVLSLRWNQPGGEEIITPFTYAAPPLA
jgi:hypothetical protein